MYPNPSFRRLPPLNALRSFESAARHESFLKASAELHVTPGAVSRLVKSLEDYLKVDLFLRSHRGVALTDEGREYASAIGKSLEMMANATDRLLQNFREPTLSICCYPTFAVHWLIPRWGEFQAAFPEALIDLRTTLSPELEDPNAYDLIVRIGRTHEPQEVHGIVNERVLDVDSFPVCSPEFLARNPSAAVAEELSHLPLIHAALRPEDWDRWLASAGSTERVGQRGMMFESLTLAYNAALSGVGVAIGVRAFVAADLAAGRLVQPVSHVRRSESGFNMYYSAARAAKLPRLRSALDWIRHQRELGRRARG
jgi:LysR family transcriptional regulator, glycine cleavage system transcriptional activator